MAGLPLFADRVKETTTVTGTGAATLLGAVQDYQSFTTAFANNTQVYYCIEDGTNWEVGQGTFTTAGPSISRDTVFESSNANAIVNFPSGIKRIFNTYPAARANQTPPLTILWDSSQASSNNRVQTWAEIVTALANTNAPMTILGAGNQTLSIPAGTYTIPSGTVFGSQTDNLHPQCTFQFADGAIFSGMTSIVFRECEVNVGSSSHNTFSFTYVANAACLVLDGAMISNSGTNDVIDVPAGNTFSIRGSGEFGISTTSGIVVDVGASGTLYFTVIGAVDSVISSNIFGGPSTATLFYIIDSTAPPIANASFLGSVDTYLCSGQSAAGSANYPTAINVGATIYDTSVNRFLVWTGTAWTPMAQSIPQVTTQPFYVINNEQTLFSNAIVASAGNPIITEGNGVLVGVN